MHTHTTAGKFVARLCTNSLADCVHYNESKLALAAAIADCASLCVCVCVVCVKLCVFCRRNRGAVLARSLNTGRQAGRLQ